MVRCDLYERCPAEDCPHSVPHHNLGECFESGGRCMLGNLAICESCACTKEQLADMVLKWWEDAQYTTVPCGDNDWDNLYDGEPNFVREAQIVKKEVT